MSKFDFSKDGITKRWKEDKRFRVLGYILGGVLALVIGYFVYRQFFWMPVDKKASESWSSSLELSAKDSADKAIKTVKPLTSKFDGHTGGEVAQYILATQYLKKGEFKKALTELEDVNVEDEYLGAIVIGLQGDCLSELKKYKEAQAKYLEAAEASDNELTRPMYLFKAGLHSEKIDQSDKACECYSHIANDFPEFAQQKNIDRYIGKVCPDRKPMVIEKDETNWTLWIIVAAGSLVLIALGIWLYLRKKRNARA